MHGRTRVKVCCIGSRQEARVAIDHGADALGLVADMPSGPGVIDDEAITGIAASLPPPIDAFLLTRETQAQRIADHARRTGVRTVQLVDDAVTPETRRELKRSRPTLRIVQVLHVVGEASIERARHAAEHADALLLDSGNPSAATPELGGTGRRHDWSVSRRVVESVEIPVFLAGGLSPDNAARAIEEVRPYGLDVCTGLRTQGRLDPDKLSRFMAAVRSA
ncbi:MAG: phosphoribosylanthranilate isomerase [Planctomycetota bacterium]